MTVAETRQPQGEPDRESEPAVADPAAPLPRRSWWHRYLEPEERRRIMADLAVTKVDRWAYRFTAMLTLSVIVAVMGLSLNSAAVVIGAMLLAPLMQPVLGCGACISMALFSKSVVALFKVTIATAWSIGIAYAISWILPQQELTSEVLSRTQPDLKDLIVALAAGTAGAYATVRADASSSLPGVAVAVALVPPLASVGIALEQGERDLAEGAFLLYTTNLAAIIFASIVVFVVTGFVPPRRLSDNLMRLTIAAVGLAAVVIVIAVPLYQQSVESIQTINENDAADRIVEEWLEGTPNDLTYDARIIRDKRLVSVEVRGFDPPPDEAALVEMMQEEFPGFGVPVQWIRPERATTTTEAPPEPTEQLKVEIRAAVDEWLASADIEYQIDDIVLDEKFVRIFAAGTGQPPPNAELLTRLQAIDPALVPLLAWDPLAVIEPESVPSRLEVDRADMSIVVQRWAQERGLLLAEFEYDGEVIEIDVLGAEQPDVARLELDLWEIAGDRIPVNVYFTQRQLVTTTLPSTIPLLTR